MAKIVKFIGFKKLVPEAQAPYQKYITDAGYDLSAVSFNETEDYYEYGTGIAVEIPTGMVGLVFPRSSVTGVDLMLKNCVGVIDSQYRGEIRCRFAKVIHDIFRDGETTEEKRNWWGKLLYGKTHDLIDIWFLPRKIKKYQIGDRVCQIIFMTLPEIKIIEKAELSSTDRGENGFGSTKNK
jgi:dUTP pyrophosphatase